MSSEYGVLSAFLLENPPAGIATGAVGTALLVSFILRMFRNEVRSAAIDKASRDILESVQADNKILRDLLRQAELDRDIAQKELMKREVDIISFRRSLELLKIDKETADAKAQQMALQQEESKTEILRLQMQVSGQLSTIEDLSIKIRAMETAMTKKKDM